MSKINLYIAVSLLLTTTCAPTVGADSVAMRVAEIAKEGLGALADGIPEYVANVNQGIDPATSAIPTLTKGLGGAIGIQVGAEVGRRIGSWGADLPGGIAGIAIGAVAGKLIGEKIGEAGGNTAAANLELQKLYNQRTIATEPLISDLHQKLQTCIDLGYELAGCENDAEVVQLKDDIYQTNRQFCLSAKPMVKKLLGKTMTCG